MKKYVSCFLFFFLLTSASLITLFLMTVGEEAQRAEEVQMRNLWRNRYLRRSQKRRSMWS